MTDMDILGYIWTNRNENEKRGVGRLTFSDFAKMLYPIIGKGQKTSDFVLELTTQIMVKSNYKHEEISHEDNPFDIKEINTLEKIYSGHTNISKKDAGVIIANLDKVMFADYISSFLTDTIDLIRNELQKIGISVIHDNDNINEILCDLFVFILTDIASGKVKTMPASTEFIASYQQSTDTPCGRMDTEIQDGTDSLLENNLLDKKMRDIFLQAASECNIMEIINRNPAYIDRVDLHKFATYDEIYSKEIASLIASDSEKTKLYLDIQYFTEELFTESLPMIGYMNNTFDINDPSAILHIEEDSMPKANKKRKFRSHFKKVKVPRTTKLEQLLNAGETVGLAKGMIRTWADFRDEMNSLYEKISAFDPEH